MKDSTNEKKTYAPPQLTVVCFKVEQGYALSTLAIGQETIESPEDYGMQDYQVENGQQWF